MTITAITHFCGDPLATLYWMRLYKKYWRKEVNKMVAHLCWAPLSVSEELHNFQKAELLSCEEVSVVESPGYVVPEIANENILKTIKEPLVFMVESDAFIFGSGFIREYIVKPLEEGADLVGAPYRLMEPQTSPRNPILGLMRAVSGARMSLLKKTDMCLLPRTLLPGTVTNGHVAIIQENFDCFGWLSYQMFTLTDKIKLLPDANMINNKDRLLLEANFTRSPFVHVRQFNSSFLGMGQPIWKAVQDGDQTYLAGVRTETNTSPTNQWYYEKGIAFRLIFVEALQDTPELRSFIGPYIDTLDIITDAAGLTKEQVRHTASFFKKQMRQ